MSISSKPANVKSEYWALGIYQIFGGAVGSFLTARILFSETESNAVVATIIIGLMTYGLSILSGIYCIRLHVVGLKYTIVNQALQILWFAIFGVSFKYGTGLYLVIGADFTESFDFILNAGLSNLKMYFSNRSNEMSFSVNVIAVWVMSRAMHVRKFLADNVRA